MVVIAVIRLSSSSLFSLSFFTRLSIARLLKLSDSPPCNFDLTKVFYLYNLGILSKVVQNNLILEMCFTLNSIHVKKIILFYYQEVRDELDSLNHSQWRSFNKLSLYQVHLKVNFRSVVLQNPNTYLYVGSTT